MRNEDIRDRHGAAPIVQKLRGRRLRWYGHAVYANENSLAKIGLPIEMDGKRLKGRPKQRWLDTQDQIRHLVEPNGETDHDEMTPAVNEIKAEEK